MNIEQVIRVMRQPLSWSLAALGVAVPTALHGSASFALAVAGRGDGASAPGYVHAGVPFIVRDGYAAQLCISSRSGRPLPPFVVRADAFGGIQPDGLQHVDAGIPFVVKDSFGTTLCVSTRGGHPLAPFVIP